MKPSAIVVILCLGVGLMIIHEEAPPKAKFDYGDNPAGATPVDPPPLAATNDYTPSSPPVGAGPPVGATHEEPPVINSVADVEKAGTSAFTDVPKDTTPPNVVASAPTPVADVPPPVSATPPVAASPPSAFSDIKPVPDDQPKSGPVGSTGGYSGRNIADCVFPIRSSAGFAGGAVAIRPDMLLAPYHVVMRGQVEVAVNNSWVRGSPTYPAGANEGIKDGAFITVPGGQFPTMKVRAPVYYEAVRIYGLTTKTVMRGFVSEARAVSLLPETQGVRSGDSGGVVVAESDDAVVGLISGSESGRETGTGENPRVVYFVRSDLFLPYIPRAGMSATAPGTAPVTAPKPTGSVFPAGQQPTAFGDVKQQPSTFTPQTPAKPQTPTVYYQQNGQNYSVQPRRGHVRWKN